MHIKKAAAATIYGWSLAPVHMKEQNALTKIARKGPYDLDAAKRIIQQRHTPYEIPKKEAAVQMFKPYSQVGQGARMSVVSEAVLARRATRAKNTRH